MTWLLSVLVGGIVLRLLAGLWVQMVDRALAPPRQHPVNFARPAGAGGVVIPFRRQSISSQYRQL